jgi:holin-like protein
MTTGAPVAVSRARTWAQAALGFIWLLACQYAGVWLAGIAPIGLPGTVIGMLLLLLSLAWVPLRAPVGSAANLLLAHLSLFFIPVSVGIMLHVGLLSQYGGRILIVLALSTWIGMAVTAVVMRRLLVRPAPSVLSSSRRSGD